MPNSSSTHQNNNNNNNNNHNNNNNNNIPYSQQEALAIGYAQYALMHTLTQQFRANYPAALLHAAAASGYLPLSAPMMAAAAAAAAAHGTKPSGMEKPRDRRKATPPESDSNNNHIPSAPSINDQPYRRETYQTLLESSRLAGQQKLPKPVPIDLRKHNGNHHRTIDNSEYSLVLFAQTKEMNRRSSPPLQVLFRQTSVIHRPPRRPRSALRRVHLHASVLLSPPHRKLSMNTSVFRRNSCPWSVHVSTIG